MYCVIYRAHDSLMIETAVYGPYETYDEAYNELEKLPAVGIVPSDVEAGCKYIDKLQLIRQ